MKSVEFCYWLQGFFEIQGAYSQEPQGLTINQVDMIKRHLNLVFVHEIDPSYPAEQQNKLNEIHNNSASVFGPKPSQSTAVMRC